MDKQDPVIKKRETVEIEGGRKLYNYTFEITDEDVEEKTETSGNLAKDTEEKG